MEFVTVSKFVFLSCFIFPGNKAVIWRVWSRERIWHTDCGRWGEDRRYSESALCVRTTLPGYKRTNVLIKYYFKYDIRFMKYKQWLILIIQYFIFVYVNVDSLAPASLTSLSACPIRCGYTCSQTIQSAQQASRQYMKVCLTEIRTHSHTHAHVHVECKKWVMWANYFILRLYFSYLL